MMKSAVSFGALVVLLMAISHGVHSAVVHTDSETESRKLLKDLGAITEDFSEPENEEPTRLNVRMQVAPAKAQAFTEDFSEPEMDDYGNNGEGTLQEIITISQEKEILDGEQPGADEEGAEVQGASAGNCYHS